MSPSKTPDAEARRSTADSATDNDLRPHAAQTADVSADADFEDELDAGFWAEASKLTDFVERASRTERPSAAPPRRRLSAVNGSGTAKRPREDDSTLSARTPAPKRLRLQPDRRGAPQGPARAPSQQDDSDSELELVIPLALGADLPAPARATSRTPPRGWWDMLDETTRYRVEQRLGPDFDFEKDDPARAWRTIPHPVHWALPDILIQWDKHTLVSKSRFGTLIRARFNGKPITDADIGHFAEARNVLIRTEKAFFNIWNAKTFKPDLFELRAREAGLHASNLGVERPRDFLPDLIAQADADTFVSGDILKRKLDSAGVKVGQLVFEHQVFIMDRNRKSKAIGRLSGLWTYARGYNELSLRQKTQLGLPATVQTERDPVTGNYRDFTKELYPREGEREFPKASSDFAQAAATGFRTLKESRNGWAEEAAAKNPRNMDRQRAGGRT